MDDANRWLLPAPALTVLMHYVRWNGEDESWETTCPELIVNVGDSNHAAVRESWYGTARGISTEFIVAGANLSLASEITKIDINLGKIVRFRV